MEPGYPRTRWRILCTPQPASGAWNMAVDEAVFEGIENGTAPSTLRLYGWEPACLSLGQLQPVAEVDLVALSGRGWDVVRRITGGRAILHANEITYSVIGPRNDPRLSGRVLDSYQKIAGGLLRALELLQLEVSIHELPLPGGRPGSPVCFEVPSIYEITMAGKKIIGSAQSRRRNVLLQHGSLPLRGDITAITQALVFADETSRQESARKLIDHATSLEAALGRVISWEQAAGAFIQGFEQVLNLELVPGQLSQQEVELAERLYREKYASREWTHRF